MLNQGFSCIDIFGNPPKGAPPHQRKITSTNMMNDNDNNLSDNW